jgi:hypothetical protein
MPDRFTIRKATEKDKPKQLTTDQLLEEIIDWIDNGRLHDRDHALGIRAQAARLLEERR